MTETDQPIDPKNPERSGDSTDPTLDASGSMINPVSTRSIFEAFALDSTRPVSDPEQIGPYKILERIGEGGMGTVYVAEQRTPVRRRVALKVIKLGMDTKQVLARFEVEHHALAIMNHPNIARVFDAGATSEGRPYFVMEHVKGIPINDYCDRNRLPNRQRLDLFIQVCHGVQHAHQKGVIHRDLKPSNILVMMQDGKPVPKIIDFGVAKATAQQLTERTLYTELGQLVGTPEYMSPEQAEMTAIDIDTRTDVYSLGVILYELLVGALPFDSKTLRKAGYAEIQRIIREVDPPRPSTRLSTLEPGDSTAAAQRRNTDVRALSRHLRGDLDWIILKALEKDRTRRYETASGLAADVIRHIDDEPVDAGPPSTRYRLGKLLRRNKLMIGAAAVVFLAITTGLVVSTTFYLRAEADRSSAVAAREQAEQAAERAKTESAKSKAIARFTEEMLRGINPDVARDMDKQLMRMILDNAAERIDTELRDQPDVEAAIRHIIGRTYGSIGVFPEADDHLKKALNLHLRVNGEDTFESLECAASLAWSYREQGLYAEADQLCRKVFAGMRRLYREEHLGTLNAKIDLAIVAMRQGRHREAENLFLQSLKALRCEHPAAQQQILHCMSNLGALYVSQSRLDEAEPILEKVLAERQRIHGEEHPATLRSMTDLAILRHDQARYDEAERLYAKTLHLRRRILGDEHPHTLNSMSALGDVYRHQSRYQEAEKLLREALAMQRKLLGDEHPNMVGTLANLLKVLNAQSKFEEARPLVAKHLAINRKLAEKPDASVNDLNRYAWELLTIEPADLRDPAAALPVAQAAVEKTGSNDPGILDTLAVAQQMTGDIDAAVRTEKTAITLLPPGSSSLRMELETNLAKFLVEQQSYTEAEPLLLALHQQLSDNPKLSAKQKQESIERIIQLYESWHVAEPGKDHDQKAADWRTKLSLNDSASPSP